VVKVGRTTNRTKGLVVDANSPVNIPDFMGTPRAFTNQIVIAGDAGVLFSAHGDSGSLIVDVNGKVVGLLFAGDEPPSPPAPGPAPDPSTFQTFANHIEEVLTSMNIRLPATAEVPAATLALAGFRADTVTAPLADAPGFFAELTDRLSASAVGTALLDAIRRHGRDVVELVNHHRRVTVAWHRGQGPAWLTAFARSVRHPEYRMPAELGGVSRTQAVSDLHAALLAEGTDELRADLRDLPGFVLSALAGCETVEELLRLVEHEQAPVTAERPR
jgi:hypothetical protein